MNKLISMEDYVLEQVNADYFPHGYIGRVCQYAQLLKSKPTLSMFVPCDDDGNVLEEPHNLGLIHLYPTNNPIMDMQLEHAIKYQTALDKVIFDGWGVYEKSNNIVHIQTPAGMMWINFYSNEKVTLNGNKINTISDLTPYNLPLKNKL